jgi:hypothetical protein
MNTSPLKKFFAVCSLASIGIIMTIAPAFAEKPFTIRGFKGTYNINLSAGTYRGCLKTGGCIILGRESLIECPNGDCNIISWRNGPYLYTTDRMSITVSKNGRIIFQDRER